VGAALQRRAGLLAPLGAYALVSYLFFRLALGSHPGRTYIGYLRDPEIFM